MTMLKAVRLYLHVDDYAQAMRSDFLFRSCYVSNFLTRHARALAFKTEGFKALLVQGQRAPGPGTRISVESNVIVPVSFDQQHFESVGAGEHHELFIGMLIEGLEKCSRHHRIPLAELMAAIEDFRRCGYRNEWTHQEKSLRTLGLHASLVCRLDTQRFTLTLLIDRHGSPLFCKQILETKPDELIFTHRFKEIVAEGGKIVVKDKFGNPIFSLDASTLA